MLLPLPLRKSTGIIDSDTTQVLPTQHLYSHWYWY